MPKVQFQKKICLVGWKELSLPKLSGIRKAVTTHFHCLQQGTSKRDFVMDLLLLSAHAL